MSGHYLEQNLTLFPERKKLHIDWKVFFASLLSGFLTHAYCMFNLVENEDTITPYSQGSTGIAASFQAADTGRWLAGLVNRLQGWYRTPVVSGVLIILILALLGQVFIRLFHVKSAAGAFLIAVFLEVSSPAQAYVNLHEVGYPLSALLAVTGVFFMEKGEKMPGNAACRHPAGRFFRTWVPAFLLESIAFVILPVNFSCAAVTVLMLLMINTVSPERREQHPFRDQWLWTLQCLAVLLCSGLFLLTSSRLIVSLNNISTTGYQGAEQVMNGSVAGSLIPNYLHSFVKLFIIGVWKIQTLPELRFAYYICYILDAVCAIVLLRKNGKRCRGLRLLHMILYFLLLPAAICSISLVSYGFMYRGQHRMPLILFLCGTPVLVERALYCLMQEDSKEKKTKRESYSVEHLTGEDNISGEQDIEPVINKITISFSGKALYWTVCAAFVLMIYAGFLFDNIGYVNQHHVMMQDQTLCTRILTKLDSTEGFSYDQPVYFLNILSTDGDESVTPMKYDPELYSVIWPVSTTNLYAYGDSSLRFYMESYEGVVFEKPSDETTEEIEQSGLREEYEHLKTYDFRIIRENGTWVVIVKTVMPPSVAYG